MQREKINLLGEEHPHDIQPERPKKRSSFFGCSILFLIVLGLFIAYKTVPGINFEDPSAYDPITLEPKEPEGLLKRLTHFVFHKDKELAGEQDDRINILLMGMGGLGHDGPYLTDTMIIASIKPSTNQIAMISIPRDLGVDIPGYGWYKINHANAYGEVDKSNWGAAFATEVVEQTFDLDIQYYIRVDFTAFEEIIDEVGGVTVSVDRAFTDPQYPAAGDLYQTISFAAGEQSMSGARALQYARSRHGSNGEGSDFARAARQQKVLLALKDKLLSFGTLANPVRINNVMESLDSHMTTNMAFSDIIAMMKLAKELDTSHIIRLVLDNGVNGYLENGFSPDGAFILEPRSGNFDEINTVIEHIFDENPEQAVIEDDTPEQAAPPLPAAAIEIQNGTWKAGMASRVKKSLQSETFTVTALGNTTERPVDKSGIYAISDSVSPEVLDAISDELNILVKKNLDVETTVATSTEILIILGEDFTE